MVRPRYESKESLSKEHDTIREIERAWKCKAQKMPVKYTFDYGLYYNGELKAVAELRYRNVSSTTYPTIICALYKLHAARDFALDGLKPYFIVTFKDGTFYHEFKCWDTFYKIDQGGRTDRGDWQDMEPVIRIPIEKFKKIT
jgi:hypothetical protein